MSHTTWRPTFRDWSDRVLRLVSSSTSPPTSSPISTRTATPLVENILDAAGQKGTGNWTVISSMELAQPVTLVAEAVFARIVSALKDQRMVASGMLPGPERSPEHLRR